jgi:hypothetical protein
MQQLKTTREERGKEIADKMGQIKRLTKDLYLVRSQSGPGAYEVTKKE